MSEFTVGSKVRVVKEHWAAPEAKQGMTGTIIRLAYSYDSERQRAVHVVKLDNGWRLGFAEDEIEEVR